MFGNNDAEQIIDIITDRIERWNKLVKTATGATESEINIWKVKIEELEYLRAAISNKFC